MFLKLSIVHFIIFICSIRSGFAESDVNINNEDSLKIQLDDLKSDVKLILIELNISRTEQDIIKWDNDRLSAELKRQAQLIDNIVGNFDRCMEEESYGRSCAEAATHKENGIYDIRIPRFSKESFKVACDMQTYGGNWTIILRRLDGSVSFYRDWRAYKNGFGDLYGEFFLGLDKIHAMTADVSQELLVLLEDYEGNIRYEMYEKFGIGDEHDSYALQILGKATGDAGDSLTFHFDQKFSTFDRYDPFNCAQNYKGAWWYKNCHTSQLTGQYSDKVYGRGINWKSFHDLNYSLKQAVMMIRPRKIGTATP